MISSRLFGVRPCFRFCSSIFVGFEFWVLLLGVVFCCVIRQGLSPFDRCCWRAIFFPIGVSGWAGELVLLNCCTFWLICTRLLFWVAFHSDDPWIFCPGWSLSWFRLFSHCSQGSWSLHSPFCKIIDRWKMFFRSLHRTPLGTCWLGPIQWPLELNSHHHWIHGPSVAPWWCWITFKKNIIWI